MIFQFPPTCGAIRVVSLPRGKWVSFGGLLQGVFLSSAWNLEECFVGFRRSAGGWKKEDSRRDSQVGSSSRPRRLRKQRLLWNLVQFLIPIGNGFGFGLARNTLM